MEKYGVDRVIAETKNVNIFKTKLIFFPFNHNNQEWTLGVVVNPGAIGNMRRSDPRAFILYLDPQGATANKNFFGQHVRTFLNGFWTQSGRKGSPFTDENDFPLFTPQGKQHL